jgi:O-antigen/teichoic acid export membrane protein
MVKRNILANSIGRIWGLISVYLFVPIYLRVLGPEAYGIVGFYVTLAGVLAFADMGLTATLNREMARLSARPNSEGDKSDILRTYEIVYVGISLLIAIIIFFLAPLISRYWLRSSTLDVGLITSAIRLMGFSIALQLPANLFIGGLFGLQEQVKSNALQIGWSMLRGFGATAVIVFISPTILAFASWQLVANAIYFIASRSILWYSISKQKTKPRFKFQVFRITWKYSAGMAGLALISTLIMQADKLAVSKMLSLETLGYYTIAAALASVPGMLAGPISKAIFPRFTGLVEVGDKISLVALYHKTSAFVAVAIIPGTLTLLVFSTDFIYAWTGDMYAASSAGPVASFLLAGAIFQSLTITPFYIALAHGNVKINLQIGVASLVLLVPLLIYFIPKYGVLGAGIAWLSMNMCTGIPYVLMLHKRFLSGEFFRWFSRGIIFPVSIVIPIVLLGRLYFPLTEARFVTLVNIGLVWFIALVVTAISIIEVRKVIIKKMKSLEWLG